ncbi:MAG: hypothetical protein AABM33_05955 [Pseudomonadota bacterium]
MPVEGDNIEIPHDWMPRRHQRRLWNYLEGGGKRAVAVWHRRAGKDSTAVNWTARSMFARVGTYWHMLPEAAQGRKVIWDAIDSEGRRVIDQAFPKSIRAGTNNQEMQIRLDTGSVWQVVGSDNYNSLVGANPVGVVMSEYSVAKPAAWDYIRPILAENGGWVIFIYTPRGKNHGKRMFEIAKRLLEEGWFAEILTIKDTGLIPMSVIEDERKSGMSDEMIEQEYFCSFEGSVEGAYYGKVLAAALKDGRITKVPHADGVPVNTFWDLGANDTTAIWFHQRVGVQHRFLLAYENSGEAPSHYFSYLQLHAAKRGYVYGRHFMPHDAETKTLNSLANKDGRNTRELFEAMGMRDIVVVPRIEDVMVGIDLTRGKLSQCWFDAEGCEPGLDALSQYHKEYDEKAQTFRQHPKHDWSSNYADAFRQFAQGWEPVGGASFKRRDHRSARTV